MTRVRSALRRQCVPVLATLILALALLWACSDSEPEIYTPACGAGNVTFDPVTGERLSAPPEVALDPIPELDPNSLPKDTNRTPIDDGLWRLNQDLDDKGQAEDDAPVRVLISLPMRNRNELGQWLERIYDPKSEVFRQYLSSSCLVQEFGPEADSVAKVVAWLKREGLTVDRIATNRLLIIASGTIAQFEHAFNFVAHRVIRVQRPDFAAEGLLSVPGWLSPHIDKLLAMQDARTNDTPRDEEQDIVDEPFEGGVTPKSIAKVYGMGSLYDQGLDGRGQTIAIVVGWDARRSDIASYIKSYGLAHQGDIDWRYIDAVPELYAAETTIDIEMSVGGAPGADVIVYLGADNTDFSLTWAINESIGQGEADIITYSYSHQEVITAWELQEMQSLSARIAAAQGMTFLAAAGDSRNVDNPANSGWVTAVGATYLIADENGERVSEVDTAFGGLGRSALFEKPDWQRTVDPESDRRAVVDLALHCNPFPEEHALTGYIYGEWVYTGGTSLSAPMLAGYLAVVNQARGEKGRLGWLNRTIYENEDLQATFFDVTEGMIENLNMAGPGWDFASGWGAPDLERWVDSIP